MPHTQTQKHKHKNTQTDVAIPTQTSKERNSHGISWDSHLSFRHSGIVFSGPECGLVLKNPRSSIIPRVHEARRSIFVQGDSWCVTKRLESNFRWKLKAAWIMLGSWFDLRNGFWPNRKLAIQNPTYNYLFIVYRESSLDPSNLYK